MVKESMDGKEDGLNGWSRIQLLSFKAPVARTLHFSWLPKQTGREHNGKRPFLKKLNLPACEAKRTKQIATMSPWRSHAKELTYCNMHQ